MLLPQSLLNHLSLEEQNNKYYIMCLLARQSAILDCLREVQTNNLIVNTLRCKHNKSEAHLSLSLEASQYRSFRLCSEEPVFIIHPLSTTHTHN